MSYRENTIEPVPPARCHDGSVGSNTIHINRPSSTRFLIRVKESSGSKWMTVGKPSKSRGAAIRRLAESMIYRGASFGEIAVVADCYDPVVVFEMRRK